MVAWTSGCSLRRSYHHADENSQMGSSRIQRTNRGAEQQTAAVMAGRDDIWLMVCVCVCV